MRCPMRCCPVIQLLALVFLAGAVASVRAEEVRRLEVGHDGGTYTVTFHVVLKAPATAVYAALTDFDAIRELTPGIIASRRMGATPEGWPQVRNTLEGCVLSFCRRMTQQWVVHESGGGLILTRIEPGPSDFSSGWALWRVAGDAQRTDLHYEAALTPSFWVPPLVGPWLIETNMAEGLRTLARRLEDRAGGG